MSVLVTGGTGFVGSHVVKLLLEKGEKVRVMARESSPRSNLEGCDVEYVIGDLRDKDSLVKATSGCRQVFHCAADYRLWVPNTDDLYKTNVDGTRNLLEACRQNSVEKTVVTSSVAAVGIPKDGTPGNEDTPVTVNDMIGHYKRSKFLAEQVAMKFAAEGDPVTVVNPSTPIGDHDIKPTDTGKIIADYLSGKMPAYVQTGLNLADVRDVARGHLLAAEKGKPGRRYILGGTDMTLKEILDVLSEISGLPPVKIEIPLWAAYIFGACDTFISGKLLHKAPRAPLDGVKMARKHMFFSCERAKKELGYEPGPARPALERAVRWFAENGYVPVPPALRDIIAVKK